MSRGTKSKRLGLLDRLHRIWYLILETGTVRDVTGNGAVTRRVTRVSFVFAGARGYNSPHHPLIVIAIKTGSGRGTVPVYYIGTPPCEHTPVFFLAFYIPTRTELDGVLCYPVVGVAPLRDYVGVPELRPGRDPVKCQRFNFLQLTLAPSH